MGTVALYGPELRFIFDFESGERQCRIFFEELVFAVAHRHFNRSILFAFPDHCYCTEPEHCTVSVTTTTTTAWPEPVLYCVYSITELVDLLFLHTVSFRYHFAAVNCYFFEDQSCRLFSRRGPFRARATSGRCYFAAGRWGSWESEFIAMSREDPAVLAEALSFTTTCLPKVMYMCLYLTCAASFILVFAVDFISWTQLEYGVPSDLPRQLLNLVSGLTCANFIYHYHLRFTTWTVTSFAFHYLFSHAIYFRFFDDYFITWFIYCQLLTLLTSPLTFLLVIQSPTQVNINVKTPLCRLYFTFNQGSSSPSLNVKTPFCCYANFLSYTHTHAIAIAKPCFSSLVSCARPRVSCLVSFRLAGPSSFQLKN